MCSAVLNHVTARHVYLFLVSRRAFKESSDPKAVFISFSFSQYISYYYRPERMKLYLQHFLYRETAVALISTSLVSDRQNQAQQYFITAV